MAIRSIQRCAFPAIQEIILAEFQKNGQPIDRYDIGPRLKDHPRTRRILQLGYSGELGNLDEYVRNVVDWYSHKWTQHEANELDPRQASWVLPTFEGIRRHKGIWPNYDWRYGPQNPS